MVKVSVSVTRMRMKLLRVTFPGGFHLVAGGRLVLEERNGKETPHPDLPAYRHEDFPVPVTEWEDDEHPSVTVQEYRNGKMSRVGHVRGPILLFTPLDPEEVKQWIIRSNA